MIRTELSSKEKHHVLEDQKRTYQAELAESDTLSANLVLVDNGALQARYDEALNCNRPYINYEFSIEQRKYMEMQIGVTRAVIAAILLNECIKISEIKGPDAFSEKCASVAWYRKQD